MIFSIKKSILGWKSTTGKFFALGATNIYYHTEFTAVYSRNYEIRMRFQVKFFIWEQQWKNSVSLILERWLYPPFLPSNYAPAHFFVMFEKAENVLTFDHVNVGTCSIFLLIFQTQSLCDNACFGIIYSDYNIVFPIIFGYV